MSKYSHAYPRPADIEAKISFIASADGGRSVPARSGYRADHNFGLANLNGAAHEYVAQDCVEPGSSALTHLWLLDPQAQSRRLYPGFKFTVQEGGRIVGYGSVVAIFNTELRRDQAS